MSVPDRIRQEVDEIQTGTDTQPLERLLSGRSPQRQQEIISALQELLDVFREQAAEEHAA